MCCLLRILPFIISFLLLPESIGFTEVVDHGSSFIARSQQKKLQSEYIGEKIIYDVKLGNIVIGKAKFIRLQNTELGGRLVSAMTFETKLANFKDLEEIYSDRKNFLPLKVIRHIDTWNSKEKIIENYDQENFTLTIIKLKGRKKEKIEIHKKKTIHNAILLPFYVRQVPGLRIGWHLMAQLPSQEFRIKLVSIEDLKLSSGSFEAYRFESVPKKFEIWVSTDKRRIPLKIKDNGKLGYTFVMREYNLGNRYLVAKKQFF